MNKSVIRCFARSLAAGWVGAMGCANVGQAVQASEPESTPQITVYVYNWAHVEPNMLRKAKEVATQIFRKAGVEATVLDAPLSPEEEQRQAALRRQSSNFSVQILSLPMAEGFGFPTQVLGIAPGPPQELNRSHVYLSDHVAERMALAQVMARVKGIVSHNATKGQILGHGIAHEIGHVLLHQASHSLAGLMRANWDRNDFQNMVAGHLLFTSEEAERVRAEITRRNAKLTALEAVRSRQE
jgi:hypothetical protein